MIRYVLRSFQLLTRSEKWRVAGITSLRLVTNALDIVAILFIGYVAGLAFSGSTENEVFLWFPQYEAEDIPYLLVVAGILFLTKTALSVLMARWLYRYLASLESKYSAAIARALLQKNPDKFQKMSRAQLEWALLRSTNFAISGVIGQSVTLIAELALSSSILVMLFIADPVPAATVFAYLIVVILIFQTAVKSRTNKSGRKYTKGSVHVSEGISDVVNAYKELTVLGKMEFFVDRIVRARGSVAKSEADKQIIQALPRLVLEVALIVGALALGAVFFSSSNVATDYSFLGLLIFGTLRIMSSLLPLQASFISLRYTRPSAESAQLTIEQHVGTRDHEPDDSTTPGDSLGREFYSEPRRGASVILQQVCFTREEGDQNFKIRFIEMDIAAGSHVAIIGPSGSGKTTLVDLILGLLIPSSGSIVIDGLNPLEFRRLRKGLVAYVPQKPGMVAGSVSDNIAIGEERSARDPFRMSEAIEAAGLTEVVDQLPQGIESNLGAHLNSLSGGQMQRIGLARALYTNPALLVLDEATSALDATTEADISESLSKLNGKVTIITIAHRLSTVKKMQKVFVMENGGIRSSGSFKELMNKDKLVKEYAELFRLE